MLFSALRLIRVQNLRSSAPAEYLMEVDPGILKGVWGAPKMVPYEFLCDAFSLYRSIREIAMHQPISKVILYHVQGNIE